MTTIMINNNHCEMPNSYISISPTNIRSINISDERSFLSSTITSKKRFRAEEDDFADLIRISSSTEISDQGIIITSIFIKFDIISSSVIINLFILINYYSYLIADEAEHREICKNISLSLFESRKLLCTVPSSNNLKVEDKIQKDIFNSFIKDMTPPIKNISRVNDDKTNDNDYTKNLTVLKDFLLSDNIWNDIYVLEQEKNVYCI